MQKTPSVQPYAHAQKNQVGGELKVMGESSLTGCVDSGEQGRRWCGTSTVNAAVASTGRSLLRSGRPCVPKSRQLTTISAVVSSNGDGRKYANTQCVMEKTLMNNKEQYMGKFRPHVTASLVNNEYRVRRCIFHFFETKWVVPARLGDTFSSKRIICIC